VGDALTRQDERRAAMLILAGREGFARSFGYIKR
jgi:hypothetical protein